MDLDRTVSDYSLHVTRNFGIMTAIGLAMSTQAQVLARSGDSQEFRRGYAIGGIVLAALVQVTAFVVLLVQEAWNRRQRTYHSAPDALVPAAAISALVLILYALFLGLFFGLELGAGN